jgi:hypothetical protein
VDKKRLLVYFGESGSSKIVRVENVEIVDEYIGGESFHANIVLENDEDIPLGTPLVMKINPRSDLIIFNWSSEYHNIYEPLYSSKF